jgi:hypothetical protein
LPQSLTLFSIKFAEFTQGIRQSIFYLLIEGLGDSSAEKKGMNDRITHETISLASATNYNVISTNPAEEAFATWREKDCSGSVREDPLLLVASELRF